MKHLIAYCLVLFFAHASGQVLHVQLLDVQTNLAVSDARLNLVGTDTLYAISDTAGRAAFNSTKGVYVQVQHIGYQLNRAQLSAGQQQLIIYLSPVSEALDEVVVTGHASPTLASKAVHKIKVIDKQRIQKQAAVSLRDVLNNELNFRTSEDAILGTQINLQGLSGAKVKVLIDGVPVIGRLDGNIDLSQVLLNDIERVELVEGPMAVQYGTDAIAGTINLITKRNGNRKFSLAANAYYESVGRYNVDATTGFSIGEWRANFNLGHNLFDGYDEICTPLTWNPKTQYFTSVGVQRRWGKLLLRYKTDFFNEGIINQGAIGSLDSVISPVDTGAWKYPRALDDVYATQRLNNSLYVDYFLSKKVKINAFAAYNYFKRTKTSTVKNLSTGEEQLFAGTDAQDTTTFGLWSSRMFFEHDLLPKTFSYQVGYDFSLEQNRGERIEGSSKSITDIALFTLLNYQPTRRINIQPGLRYIYNSRFEAPLIASLSTRFQLAEDWVFRASYGQGFRAPTLKELYFLFVDENHNILGNEDLKAESADNVQAGITYATRLAKNTNLKVETSGFYNRIQNEIRLVAVVDPGNEDPRGLYTHQNIAQTETAGGSISAKLQYTSLEIEPGLSVIGVKNNLAYTQAAQESAQAKFNVYPQYRLNMSYTFSKLALTPSVFIQHTGARRDLSLDASGNLSQRVFSEYTMLDVNLQKSFLKKQITLSVGVKNALNVRSIQITGQSGGGGGHSTGTSSIPLSYGRSFFVRFQYTFK